MCVLPSAKEEAFFGGAESMWVILEFILKEFRCLVNGAMILSQICVLSGSFCMMNVYSKIFKISKISKYGRYDG